MILSSHSDGGAAVGIRKFVHLEGFVCRSNIKTNGGAIEELRILRADQSEAAFNCPPRVFEWVVSASFVGIRLGF